MSRNAEMDDWLGRRFLDQSKNQVFKLRNKRKQSTTTYWTLDERGLESPDLKDSDLVIINTNTLSHGDRDWRITKSSVMNVRGHDVLTIWTQRDPHHRIIGVYNVASTQLSNGLEEVYWTVSIEDSKIGPDTAIVIEGEDQNTLKYHNRLYRVLRTNTSDDGSACIVTKNTWW